MGKVEKAGRQYVRRITKHLRDGKEIGVVTDLWTGEVSGQGDVDDEEAGESKRFSTRSPTCSRCGT